MTSQGEAGAGCEAPAPEDQTPADAGQTQVLQLPPPGAHLGPESPGIVTMPSCDPSDQ